MRLELMKRTDLAFRAMRALAERGDRVAGQELAELLGTTHTYLPQIISPLLRKRWVTSDRGPNGGYRLDVDPARVSLLDLIEAMEGPTDTTTCVLTGADCGPTDPCALHDSWVPARDALLCQLRAVSMAQAWSGATAP